jgi:hypothetical protein
MTDIHKLSEKVIDLAERAANVADAAQGKGRTGSIGMTRWVMLPAAGAALYALVRTEFFTRQAKDVVDEAKTRASDLPNDLMKTVRQTPQKPAGRSGNRSQRRRQASSARKTTSRT